jgi:hypothetical protein
MYLRSQHKSRSVSTYLEIKFDELSHEQPVAVKTSKNDVTFSIVTHDSKIKIMMMFSIVQGFGKLVFNFPSPENKLMSQSLIS